MAWVSKETMATIKPLISELGKKYGVKISVRGTNSRSLDVVIKSGKLDLLGDYKKTTDINGDLPHVSINHYYWQNYFSDLVNREFIGKLIELMNHGNWDNSDAMVDYFDVGWYIHLSIGEWNRPYEYTGA